MVWGGGVANVVSSLISESGGLSVSDDTRPGVMNLVNSLVSVYAYNSNIQRLQAFAGGELNITASSILQDVLYNTSYTPAQCNCDPYACAGKPLTANDGGTITLQQIYVSLINAQDGLIPIKPNPPPLTSTPASQPAMTPTSRNQRTFIPITVVMD